MTDDIIKEATEFLSGLAGDIWAFRAKLEAACGHSDITIVKGKNPGSFDAATGGYIANVYCQCCAKHWSFNSVRQPEQYDDPAKAVLGV